MQLCSSRLVLRQFLESDSAFVSDYESDPEVVRYATHGVRSFAESLAHIRATMADSCAETRRIFDFAVVRREEGKLIGRCGMKITNLEQREAMLWYVLNRREWGRGYALEAAQAVLGFGFEEISLHRIFVDIDPRNVASVRVAEKLGLRREAHFLENAWIKGEWTDSVVFACLDREYRARSEALKKSGKTLSREES